MNDISAALVAFKNSLQGSWDWEADALFAECADNIDPELIKLMRDVAFGGGFGMGRVRTHDVFLRHKITKRRLAALRKLIKSGDVTADWAGTGPGGASELGTRRVRMYTLETSFYKVTRVKLASNSPALRETIFVSQSAMNAYSPRLWGTEDFGDKIVISWENAEHRRHDAFSIIVIDETEDNYRTVVRPENHAFSHTVDVKADKPTLRTFYFIKEQGNVNA